MYIAYQIDKKNSLEYRSNNRSLPPNKKIDHAQAICDITLKGKKEYYKNHLAGKYDIDRNAPPIKGSKEAREMEIRQSRQNTQSKQV